MGAKRKATAAAAGPPRKSQRLKDHDASPADLTASEPEASKPAPKAATRRQQKPPAPTAPTPPPGNAAAQSEYWLMKAEPETRIENGVDVKFSIDDLQAAAAPEPWDGVRNHVAKNNMKAMRKGDLGFFYHSNCKVPGIAGVLEIAEEADLDESAFNPKHPYYDAKSSRDKPRWYCVRVKFHSKYPELIPLKKLQEYRDAELKDMQLLKQSRLSVSRVSKAEWDFINTTLG